MAGNPEGIAHSLAPEEALKQSAERLSLAVAAADLGDWVWDPDTDLLTLSDRAAEIFGMSSASAITRTRMRDLLHEEDRAAARIASERAVATRGDYDIEYRVIRASDRKLVWVAAKGRGQYDDAGRIIRMLGVVQDITDRKMAEQALAEAQRRYRAIFDATTDGLIINGPDGRVIEANPAACRMHGYTYEQFMATPSMNFIYPDDLPLFAQFLEVTGRGEEFNVKARDVRRDGSVFPVDVRGTSFMYMGQRHTLGVVRDITEREQAEQERERLLVSERAARAQAEALIIEKDRLLESERAARSDAERASRMKDEFLATLSHELRTPLNAILGWSQILQTTGTPDPEDFRQGMETIERNARAQTRIIEDLLEMSRIISGKIRLDVQRVNLASVIEAAVETLRHAADAKGIRLQLVLDPLAGPVFGDPSRLQQVFWNLLSNSVKFSPRGGRVQILLERVNSHVEVSVVDSGEGIKPEFLPFVFDRFRQADASTTRRHGGLGLGLSIVKQLVELHGGNVRVRSPGVGQGSTFTVTLPLTPIHAEPEPHRRHPQAHADMALPARDACVKLNGLRVLVVDDEPDAREVVRRLLEDCEAIVTTADSAANAMAALQKQTPDVLVSDIGMPGEDGYSLIRRIRALGSPQLSRVPAIALTAYARSEDRTRAMVAGFQSHVAKPVEPSELVAAVASLAGLRGAQ